MAYSGNYLTNPSAETGDTSGWTIVPEGSVTAEEKTEIGEELAAIKFLVGDRSGWIERPTLLEMQLTGAYNFLLASDASMSQIVTSGTFGSTPLDFKVTIAYKLVNAQDLWDANVRAKVNIIISYTDGGQDVFVIPCVLGLTYSGRNLANFWIYIESICTIANGKTASQVSVEIETISLQDGLLVDYIELRKNLG